MSNATIAVGFNVKNMSQNGCFEGYASLFDVTDQVHDRVARGAFARTLADWRRNDVAASMRLVSGSRSFEIVAISAHEADSDAYLRLLTLEKMP